jgi:hypothetical protein
MDRWTRNRTTTAYSGGDTNRPRSYGLSTTKFSPSCVGTTPTSRPASTRFSGQFATEEHLTSSSAVDGVDLAAYVPPSELARR